jgi:hypothetical protein
VAFPKPTTTTLSVVDEPFEISVRLDSPDFADEVTQGFREATDRGLHADGDPRRVTRDGVTYHVQSFADRMYFNGLRHLLLYRQEDGWSFYVTTTGISSVSGRLYREGSQEDRTLLPSDAPADEAQELALSFVQDHSRLPVTVQWQAARTLADSWVGELATPTT